MKPTHYDRLSALDHAFLALEAPTTAMHVAATAILDATPLRTASGTIDMPRIKRYVASRLHVLPRYRQRLGHIPIENRPVWVDDDEFQLDYHIRHSSLPKPGSTEQLQELCCRLIERPLDRRHPLWEMWVIEGLAGDRVALLMKVHHCMVDGIAGVDLMAALFRIDSDTSIAPEQPWEPRPAPSDREMLGDEIRRRARLAARAIQSLPQWLNRENPTTRRIATRLESAWSLIKTGMQSPAATPLNQTIGAHRRLRWVSFDMAEVKEVKNLLGGTVNDVVLTTVSGAMERFLAHRGHSLDADLRIGVPVNVHSGEGERGMGNHVWAWLVPVSAAVRGPIRRFRELHRTTEELKASQQALAGEVITDAVDWTSSNLMPVGARLLHSLQPYNVLVTNVPGPQFPLYLLGARIDELYPYVPLFENQGVALALFSYDGKLNWAIGADWDLVPDVDVFARCLREAFRHLRRAALRKQPGKPTGNTRTQASQRQRAAQPHDARERQVG